MYITKVYIEPFINIVLRTQSQTGKNNKKTAIYQYT